MDDGTNPAHTFTFDTAVDSNASTDTIMGAKCTGSSDLALKQEIANSMRDSINAAYGIGSIAIKDGISPYLPSLRVEMSGALAGVALNGQVITGSAVSNALITPLGEFAGASPSSTTTVFLPEVRSPGSAYTRPPWTAGKPNTKTRDFRRNKLCNWNSPR